MPSKTNRNWFIDIFFITLATFIFYRLWLGSYPLFTPDEGRYTEIAREMVASSDYITPRLNGAPFLDKPILYYWLESIAIYFFGIKEWALRLMPVLFGVFGCVITYIGARQLFDRRSALLSALILATTPLYFGATHYANLDLELAVLVSSSLICLITGITRKNNYFLYLAYFFGALAFLTKGLVGIVFPAAITGIWLIITRQIKLITRLHLVTGLLLFIAIAAPWYLLAQRANPDFFNYFFITQHFSRFLSEGDFNNKSPIWFYLPIILIGFFPWTIFVIQALIQAAKKIFKKDESSRTTTFILIWFLFILTFFSLPNSKIVGYILPVFPPLALLTGHYLATISRQSNKLAIAILILLNLFIGTMLVLLTYRHWLDINNNLNAHLYAIACTLMISAVLSIYALLKNRLKQLIGICALCSIISLLILTNGATHINNSSAKSLVIKLKNIRHANEPVIAYFKYYQDVPLYLEQPIFVVADWDSPNIANRDNWVRELWLGKQFQGENRWLMTEEKFWQQWNSKQRVFVFLNDNYLERFREKHPTFYIIKQVNDILLISNQFFP